LLEKQRPCQNLRLHICMQYVELGLKFVGHFDRPLHSQNMTYNPYVFKYITGALRGQELEEKAQVVNRSG
jgi:hypothetical protein